MRTYSDTSPRAYVTDGQRRYTMYTSAPSATIEPTVPMSPPPWDGSAEGYGPEATDYGVFYRKADAAMGGCGCGGRGLGAMDETTKKYLTYGGIALGAFLLYKLMKR